MIDDEHIHDFGAWSQLQPQCAPRGEGIGLTLVREILSGHGFDYSLEQHPGEPTRFTMVF